MKDTKNVTTKGSGLKVDRRGFVKAAATMGLVASVPAGLLGMTTPAQAAPKRGGKLRQALVDGSASDSLDPRTLLGSHPISVSWQVRNNLTEITPDGDLLGELAESWEPSNGAKTWTFKLRKGVEFHNGKTLDAKDVVYSIDVHRGETSKSAAKGIVQSIVDIKADGADTVIFTLMDGNADFPYVLADHHLVIVIAGTTGADWDKGIGTGPYILSQWEPGVRGATRRNPNYFKAGKPYFDEVETLNITDPAARTNALLTGDVDVIEEADIKTLSRLQRSGSVVVREAAGTKHYTYPMHTGTAPFGNADFRLAMKYAIDREALLRTTLRGHGYLGNDHPIGKKQRFFASDLEQRQMDLDKAKFHAKKANIGNTPIELFASDMYSGSLDAATILKENAASAGINIKLNRQPSDGFWSDVWLKKPFVSVWWGGRPTEDWMFSLAYKLDSSWNDTAWNNERFQSLLLDARAELDFNKRRDMYWEMQQLMRDDASTLIPVFANWVCVTSDKVKTPDDISGSWSLDGLRNHERWWFA